MAVRQFLVSCRRCQRPIALERTLGNPALARFESHLLVCQPGVATDALADSAELLRYFRIETMEPDAPSPTRGR